MADAVIEPAAPAETPSPPMTADELLRLLTGMGKRYELVKGMLKTMSPAGFRHGSIVAMLTRRLVAHAMDAKLGRVAGAETGYVLQRNPDTVRAPDISFVTQARLDQISLIRGFFPGAPALAVEVVSPNDTASYVAEKTTSYFEAGTRQVWNVYPDQRQVAVFISARESIILAAADTLTGGDLLPGFACPVAEIFE